MKSKILPIDHLLIIGWFKVKKQLESNVFWYPNHLRINTSGPFARKTPSLKKTPPSFSAKRKILGSIFHTKVQQLRRPPPFKNPNLLGRGRVFLAKGTDVWFEISSNSCWNPSKSQISCYFVEFHNHNFEYLNLKGNGCDFEDEHIVGNR